MKKKELQEHYRRLKNFVYTIRRIEMKPLTIILFVSLALFLVAGCKQAPSNNNVTIHGSGRLVSREETITDFDTIEVALHWRLDIQQGKTFNITITSDDNFIDFIDVVQQDKTVSFDFKPQYAYNINGVTLNARVTVPDNITLHLDGASAARLENLEEFSNFRAKLTGTTALTGQVQAKSVTLDVGQNAYVELSGTTDDLSLETCGNSITDLSRFSTGNAQVTASCASSAVVNVIGDLAVEASQNSRVTYAGNPNVKPVAVHESASVKPRW